MIHEVLQQEYNFLPIQSPLAFMSNHARPYVGTEQSELRLQHVKSTSRQFFTFGVATQCEYLGTMDWEVIYVTRHGKFSNLAEQIG